MRSMEWLKPGLLPALVFETQHSKVGKITLFCHLDTFDALLQQSQCFSEVNYGIIR